MVLLALDTATPVTAVALLDGSRVLGERQQPAGNHSRALLPAIEELFGLAGLSPMRLKAVAVGLGPGSFTGVRIGLSLAKALAFARGIPLLGLSSLRVLAENGRDSGVAEVCTLLDALKGEVYCARWTGADLAGIEPEAARAPGDWAATLAAAPARRLLLGSGVLRYREIFGALGEQAEVPSNPEAHHPSAAALGRLALIRLERGERDDPRSLEPLYCRLSEAEISRQSRPAPRTQEE